VVFTDIERAKSDRRAQRSASYAKRFAAKEACAKALGTGLRKGVFWRDMGVVNLPGGKPGMKLTGGALARLRELTRQHIAPRSICRSPTIFRWRRPSWSFPPWRPRRNRNPKLSRIRVPLDAARIFRFSNTGTLDMSNVPEINAQLRRGQKILALRFKAGAKPPAHGVDRESAPAKQKADGNHGSKRSRRSSMRC